MTCDNESITFIKLSLNSAVMFKLVQRLKDPLYRNSFFIMLSSITNSGFGFFFWMVAENVKKLKNENVNN